MDINGRFKTAFDDHILCPCKKKRYLMVPVTYDMVCRGAKKSCHMCDMIKRIMRGIVDGKIPSLFRGPVTNEERDLILKNMTVGPRSSVQGGDQCGFPIWINGQLLPCQLFLNVEEATSGIPGISLHHERRIGPTTDSEMSLCWADKWLKKCVQSHRCAPQRTGLPPTRLLDIRGDSVRLIESDRSLRSKPYVCLSYRWGGPDKRRLISTVRTIQYHIEGIAWGNIPKTFEDAVRIARRMNVGYLWIDSLCILQEFDGMTKAEEDATKADFAKENSAMASIYTNSYFTISADISTSMDSGIFSKTPIEDYKLDVVDDHRQPAFVYIRKHTTHAQSPTELETRGWTLQEFLLPPRVMQFGEFDISWRCRESHTCECGHITGGQRWREQLGMAAQPIEPGGDNARQYWKTVVRFYGQRVLTNPQDKLPALSGLAQRYLQSCPTDNYLAGLWKKSLIYDLCWFHVRNPGDYPIQFGIGKRNREYRAPSWSWASIEMTEPAYCCSWDDRRIGQAAFISIGERRPICTIHHAVCQQKTLDPTGEVEYGFIDMSAQLITANIHLESTSNGPWTIRNLQDNTTLTWCIPDYEPQGDGLQHGNEVYCVPIQECLSESESQRGCLIVKAQEDRPGVYQRIGFCILTKRSAHADDEQVDRIRDKWMRGFPEIKQKETDSRHAFHRDPAGESRITII